MALNIFNSKSVTSGSEMMLSNLLLNSRNNVKGSPLWCSCRGYIPRASYSNTSQNSTSAVGQHDYIDSYSYQIDRINGSSSSAFFKKIDILDAFDDEYGGVMVNPERLPSNSNVFARALRLSVHHWKIQLEFYKYDKTKRFFGSSYDDYGYSTKGIISIKSSDFIKKNKDHNPVLTKETFCFEKKGKKGVWLKLPLEKSDLVPVAVKEGFLYHHAERSFVMLTFWIPDGPSLLPSNASHHVGVGGFVINDKDEVLVVQETHCARTLHGLWKIPTGFILESEEIHLGAVREVKEETGIDTEFVEVVAFRHAHNVSFEKSDLFFVCMLRPLSTVIRVDDHEIQEAKWMPLEDFVNQPLIQEDSMFKKIIDICTARLEKRYCGLSVHQLFSKFDGKLSSLYFNIVNDQDSDCRAE